MTSTWRLAAAGLYAVAYTLELALSMVVYFGQEKRAREARSLPRPHRVPRARRAGLGSFAALKTDPVEEFAQEPWVPIHIGGLDLSITKAVAYLMLASVVTIVFGLVFMRMRLGVRPGSRQTLRRDHLRPRAEPDRGAGPAVEGDRPLVPVRRDALPLRLDREPARLHPAAAQQRAHAHRRGEGADLRDLRGDLVDLGDARARAPDLRLHARRGHPPQRAGALLQELDPGRAEADAAPDRAARGPRPVHAPDLAERPSLREHARGAHDDPDLPRPRA